MIEYIKGKLAEINPAVAVVETAGIGYEINISLTTFSAIEKESEVKLLIHEIIREDTHDLYGFLKSDERDIFRQLIGVSGIGANTARMILSAMSPSELAIVITSGDHTKLKNVKGIGTKTAQRIIVDLRDKIKPSGETLIQQSATHTDAFDEALTALTILGYSKSAVEKVLVKLFNDNPLLRVEDAIRAALKML